MSNAIFEQDNLDWRNQLEQSIIKKMSEKESIAKLVKVSNLNNIGKVKESTSKDSENQLAVLDKEISKIREDLDCLKSGDMPKIELLLKSLNEKAALSACNGHYFKKRVLNKPQDCGQCREALWVASDGVKTVMECEVCRATCHNYCKLNFDISCQDYTKLKDVLPNVYFI